MPERDPWDWQEGQHWHQRDTNGHRYRCPVAGCWWIGTGTHAPVEASAASVEHGGEDLSGKLASSGNGDRR